MGPPDLRECAARSAAFAHASELRRPQNPFHELRPHETPPGHAIVCPAAGVAMIRYAVRRRTGSCGRRATSAGLRFAPFQPALGAGTVIEIAARRASAAIGKHSRFVIRKGVAPTRVDSCLMPGTSWPSKCTRR